MKFLSLALVVFLFPMCLKGNDTIDSLEKELASASNIDQGVIQLALANAYQRVDLGKSQLYAKYALNSIGHIDSLKIQSLDLIARSFFYQSKLDSALLFFKLEQEQLQQNNQEDKLASLNISIGSVLLRKGDFENAVSAFISSATFFESIEDQGSAAKCYTNMATAFAELDDYPSAIDYSLKALPIVRELRMLQVEMILLPNLATQFLKNGDKKNAIRYYKEAEELALANDGKRSLALIYNNLGELYLTNESYDLAEEYLNKAIDAKRELNQTKGLEEAYFNVGLLNYKKGYFRKAQRFYDRSLPSAKGFDRVKILYSMKDLHRDMGEIGKALDYADEAKILADSLGQSESIAAITELNAKYNSAKQENDILKLSSENQKLEITRIRNRLWALFLGSGLVISILALYLNWKSAKRKELIVEQKHELEQQQMMDKVNQHEQVVIEKMIVGQEEERKRIAGDLHDSLGSKLSTLKRYIEKISMSPNLESEAIQSAMIIADDSYTEVRKIAHEMNSGMLVEHGLLPAIEEMVRNKSKAHDINMNLNVHDMEGRLENYLEIQIFRIIQELTNNVLKHASASEITIQLTRFSDYLNLMVEDDGVGFAITKIEKGMGLKSISRRLDRINGNMNLDSSQEAGTTIIIDIPL